MTTAEKSSSAGRTQTLSSRPTPRILTIPYHPFTAQRRFHDSPARFRVLVAGRRFGKTKAAVNELIRTAIRKPGSVNWWVAPTFSITRKGWRELFAFLPPEIVTRILRTELMVELRNRSSLWFKSADNPDSLLSEGLDFLVVDEAARVSEEAWGRALRPALTDKLGRAAFTTTPAGKNWLYRMWLRGQDMLDPEVASWRFATGENPHIPPQEIAAAQRTMVERYYRQEYLAAFEEDVGTVFPHARRQATGALEEPQGKDCVIGVDWGKHRDASVFVVLDVARSTVVALDRQLQVDYTLQMGRLAALVERWRPRMVVAEMNSAGDPLVEQLRRDLPCPVEGFLTTAASKQRLIDSLALAIERGDLTYPDLPELIGELEAFRYELTAAGNIRYASPGERYHDDCVMALALAWHAVAHTRSPTVRWLG